MAALRYRPKPMTKGFTAEGGVRFAFPPYALSLCPYLIRQSQNLELNKNLILTIQKMARFNDFQQIPPSAIHLDI